MKSHAEMDADEPETTKPNGSRFSAVKHGLTAKTAVLPGEDPELFQAKIDMYKASLETRTPLEEELAERAAKAAWRHDRALRDEVARLNREKLTKAAADQRRMEIETEARGQRLLFDRRGPTELYAARAFDNKQARTSWVDDPNDPDHPKQIVLAMEGTLCGCQWLRQNFRELRDILDMGVSLQSHDKFRLIRIMGREPINAISVPEVARVFLACHVLEPQSSYAFQELRCEIHEDQFKAQKRKLERWNKVGITPADPAAARAELLAIIDQATERLRMLEAKHQEFADQLGQPENSVVSHDDDKARGQLDRHLEICDRSIHRSLQGIKKLQRNEAEGWGRTRREREGRRNRDDERLVVDERGTLRPAHSYHGNLEEGLARYDAHFGRSGLNRSVDSRNEIEETHVRAVPDFARWTPPVEDHAVSGPAGLTDKGGRMGQAVEPAARLEGDGDGDEQGDPVTQVLMEPGGQSSGQNEIGGSQLSVVSGQLDGAVFDGAGLSDTNGSDGCLGSVGRGQLDGAVFDGAGLSDTNGSDGCLGSVGRGQFDGAIFDGDGLSDAKVLDGSPLSVVSKQLDGAVCDGAGLSGPQDPETSDIDRGLATSGRIGTGQTEIETEADGGEAGEMSAVSRSDRTDLADLADLADRSRRLTKRGIKRKRRELTRIELERRRSGSQQTAKQDKDDVPLREMLDSVKWLFPNSVKVLRDYLPRSP